MSGALTGLFRERGHAEIVEPVCSNPPLPYLRRRANPVQHAYRIPVVSDYRINISRPEATGSRVNLQGFDCFNFALAGDVKRVAGLIPR
jgi:hypothetical protein